MRNSPLRGLMSKDKLKQISGELKKASKMHAGQARKIDNSLSSPMTFKGADSSNSSCWKGYRKVGTKKSPSGTGKTVNDCKKI